MAENILVSNHLSSLYNPSQVSAISIHTSKRNTPLPPSRRASDPPAEHALSASLFFSKETGSILVRLIHNGLIVELVSLTTDTPPIRFVFPSAVLLTPAAFLSESRELHVLAVTSFGSLYRLVLPIRSSSQLWHEPMSNNWCREYHVRNMQGPSQGIVQVHGTHCVAVALDNGSLIRLDADFIGDDSFDDQWTETLLQHNSFLTTLTAFLPGHQSPADGSRFVSITSHPQPTDLGHVWTLSRDRTLRLWTARSGCVAARTLPSSLSTGTEGTPVTASSSTLKPSVLLDPEPQKLLAVFSVNSSSEGPYVLAFVPTPSSLTSGGFFQLFSAAHDSLQLLETIEASKYSVHCHLQDFLVLEGRLYTLWDHQGQSTKQSFDLLLSDQAVAPEDTPTWQIAAYPFEPELTPAYIDELLLAPGSLTDKLFSAIMQPGMFSPYTLRTAIDEYTDSYLLLPGPPPPQLRSSYATVGENIATVVGCTVNLTQDAHTGVAQYDKYWITLKRDWEGFIARCREVERSARWPLALGVGDPHKKDIVFVERERVGVLAAEDLPMRLHRLLSSGGEPLEAQFTVSEIAWTLRCKLGARIVRTLEEHMVNLVHQEIAFPFADIIHDQAQRSLFKEEIDEGLESWILGRLQSVENIDAATRVVLDVVGGLDKAVKCEEGVIEPSSEWTSGLTAAYATYSVNARYEFCICLITLLFFLSEDLPEWDPSLLAEVFAVFRGIAMLRYVGQQPTGDHVPSTVAAIGGSADADDVIARLRNLDVSHGGTTSASRALLHRLLAGYGGASGGSLAAAAHMFLDSTGMFEGTSPAHARKPEVMWCERFRLMGRYEVAREMLEWLPRTPAVMYVWARLWLDVGRDEDAAAALDNIAGSFGPNKVLTAEDAGALESVLPGTRLFNSDFEFYLHASALFKSALLTEHEVHFSQLALAVVPPNRVAVELWYSVIKGSIDLGYYDDAYSALMTTPYDNLRRDCARQLVYRMCEEHAVEKLMSFNFVGIVDEIEDSLSFKARNADPRVRPFYSRILYTWYISRGDYRNAALVMYQRATKLSTLTNDLSQYIPLVEQQLEAYVVAINALSLLDQKNAWIVLPLSSESDQPARKRRKFTRHIPEDKISSGKRDCEIVQLSDIVYEYTLSSARLDLVRGDPSLLTTGEALLSPSNVVLRLAQANRFNMALATARTLEVDMTDLFAHLTRQCLRLSRNPDAVISEYTSDWLLTDNAASWPGTPADQGWRYLKQALDRHDSAETDMKYTKIVFETISGFDRSSPPPPWLVQSLVEYHPDWLIRTALRYDILEFALEQTLSLIRKSNAQISQDLPKTAMSTWLPYTLIDQVLIATAEQTRMSKRAQRLRQDLDTEISNRIKRMQKLSRSL
ncbi:hypothetical protein EW146_g6244 [Bondarzewia mesenterica]|uniref:Nuclear pore complex protein Nup160 n=1 Tax=Bondarzewia mesenterica TaxID=1095465 RepID=A0A4S4LPA1_9AGAM|nr:hypothetical protein EW146_g6244 [Bondarzewia mesenterica]